MSTLNDVSDTALWVAVYRADETKRPDAIFRDPLAEKLLGERARIIEASMSASRYTRWTVVVRTYLIDKLITELVAGGVETVINLGAGLDTRPYRMNLPATLRWVEVDYPHMIQLKKDRLAEEKPRVQLERFGIDLADEVARRDLFSKLGADPRKALVLTEGLVPYLTREQAASLGRDLHAQKNFHYWIVEYLSPELEKYMRNPKRMRQMKNAPFQFFPQDWYGFFEGLGWHERESRFLADAADEAGRKFPAPWWLKLLGLIGGNKVRNSYRKMSAYVLLEQK